MAAEEARTKLLQLQAKSAAVESMGQAAAEAEARARAAQIEGKAAVEQATLKSEAQKIMSDLKLKINKDSNEAEAAHTKATTELEVGKAEALSKIEADKFGGIVGAIGVETLRTIAKAGPEMQKKLLQGLGLKTFMITDGNAPVNLFNTAGGLIGLPDQQ